MKWLKNKTLSFVLCFLSSFSVVGQFDIAFVKHLSTNQLSKEHLTYIESSGLPTDSMAYYKAKYFIQYEMDSLFFQQCDSAINILASDTFFVRYLDNYFLKKKESYREQWFTTRKMLLPNQSTGVDFYYQLAKSPSFKDTSFIPHILHDDFKKYAKAYKKKPVVALILSAVLPGLGELYIGNLRASIAKFGSQTIFGLQIAESIYTLGLLHPLPLVNIGFFSVFYAANIVGSYRDTKTKKNDLKNQFLYHTADYYASMYPASIYK